MYTILICDDEKDIVSALKIYLESEGYATRCTFNGQEALAVLEREEIQLVLLVIMMRSGMAVPSSNATRRVL